MQEREEKKLVKLNELRRRAVGPVLTFRKEFETASGLDKSRMLYDFLQAVHAGESLKTLAQQLASNGQTAVAEQQNTVWEMLMDMLNKLALAVGESVVPAKRYRELFSVLLGCVDLGQIPQGLDVITVGAADRIRHRAAARRVLGRCEQRQFPANAADRRHFERHRTQNFGILRRAVDRNR